MDRAMARLSDFAGDRNVLLVFHPFAFTPVCEEEALDLEENLDSFRQAETEVVFVSCDSAPVRMPRIRCRVVCGLGLTILTLRSSSAFRSVDLPTFGRPTIATKPQRKVSGKES